MTLTHNNRKSKSKVNAMTTASELIELICGGGSRGKTRPKSR